MLTNTLLIYFSMEQQLKTNQQSLARSFETIKLLTDNHHITTNDLNTIIEQQQQELQTNEQYITRLQSRILRLKENSYQCNLEYESNSKL